MSTIVVEGVEVDTRHWINGERVASAATFTDVSPIDEAPLGEIAAGGPAEVDAAVRAARAAFPAWAVLPVAERSAVLRRVADGIDARAEDLARNRKFIAAVEAVPPASLSPAGALPITTITRSGDPQPSAAARESTPSSASPDSSELTTSASSRASQAPRASAACAYT